MKKILFINLTIFICFVGFMSCDDWTDTEAKGFNTNGKSPEYYENLRKWKAETDHDMSFGWFAFWSANGVDLKSSMIGLPDSMHIVSVWGPWLPGSITPEKRKDMEHVQNVKGTKVIACMFLEYIGQQITEKTDEGRATWGWDPAWKHTGAGCTNCVSSDPATRELQIAAIQKFARVIADSVRIGGYDGLDIDYEPQTHNAAELVSHPENTEELVKELANYFGPKSPNPGTILAIDGHVNSLTPATVPYLNYLILQAYNTRYESTLNTNIKMAIDKYSSEGLSKEEVAKKYFVTVNFESYSPTGGGDFYKYDENGKRYTVNMLQGFAEWQPEYNGEILKKGGYGSYHIEMEYVVANKSGFYPWTRSAIKAVHPPKE